mmetsp:Transcript_1746/g.3677  ORF Transcript_1746/g.3677 Transcript_1746/m.3677 type:complete len:82 (+) Transcript_1746:132-377(+)
MPRQNHHYHQQQQQHQQLGFLPYCNRNHASIHPEPIPSNWTIQFIQKTISYIHTPTKLYSSRAAIGIIKCPGPYNYPLNDT